MRLIIVKPHNKKEFDSVFSWMAEFSNEQKHPILDNNDDIGFFFLMKETDRISEVAVNIGKKPVC